MVERTSQGCNSIFLNSLTYFFMALSKMNCGPVTTNNNNNNIDNNKLPKNRFDQKTPTGSGRNKGCESFNLTQAL